MLLDCAWKLTQRKPLRTQKTQKGPLSHRDSTLGPMRRQHYPQSCHVSPIHTHAHTYTHFAQIFHPSIIWPALYPRVQRGSARTLSNAQRTKTGHFLPNPNIIFHNLLLDIRIFSVSEFSIPTSEPARSIPVAPAVSLNYSCCTWLFLWH